ncbi:MAG: hypothetical protein ACFCUV_12880 [Rivularia sp. (in: cyanobacteria)]
MKVININRNIIMFISYLLANKYPIQTTSIQPSYQSLDIPLGWELITDGKATNNPKEVRVKEQPLLRFPL